METPTNARGKQKAGETPFVTSQALQVVSNTSLTPIYGSTTRQVMSAPFEDQTGIPLTEGVMPNELPVNCRTQAIVEYDGTTDPQEHLSHFEYAALLHQYTDGIKCRVFVTTFARAAQQWFNQLPLAVIGSFQKFRSLFLHQFTSSRKHRKTELSLFSIC
ncbi:UNVERIFIED_CONTAM: hypothetical protein Sradi_2085900 [Sesamum radiatum]|uniref:Retrotransposon gag domain-containing protein n=1 Tax=Sesamum radiatum TaxID=300843 RepID=A0AAW2TIB7_SESRA